MAELKIPNFHKNSDKNLFKKKLTLRRKSRLKLIGESILMLLTSAIIIYINYLIPGKVTLFKYFNENLLSTLDIFINLITYIIKISLVIFIVLSLFFSVMLVVGALHRILKVLKRRTKRISFK